MSSEPISKLILIASDNQFHTAKTSTACAQSARLKSTAVVNPTSGPSKCYVPSPATASGVPKTAES